ncbi:TetR/AcrR family transcriptional regulator [Schlegelella sp. S2-27]|uniref:TetR/AcrR family transcriptional regulator n=1 Tax=Caldimonas mangrovi TaxID=2944811 RepID=A0ABT0YGQ5_9BURK|nr:TetR/AcrR family transcriptional regulator [Caldimonas mangrovi]
MNTPAAVDTKRAAGLPRKGRIRQEHEAGILRAAERVFARAGFSAATMNGIAQEAGLPKSNLHYYFRTKQAIYRAVLTNILQLWLAPTEVIRDDRHPGDALAHYIRAKMKLTAERPDASRVFANEVLHGAPEIGGYLRRELRALVRDKARVIDGWIARGWMRPLDPVHLFFTIWAATQTYADFDAQVCAVLGRRQLTEADFERATEHVVSLVLQGCGVMNGGPGALLAAGSPR